MLKVLLLGWTALVVACVAASTANLTAKETVAAKKLYRAKCAKCHRFYEPTDYSEKDWRQWMEKMGKKSKLKPDDATLLNRYLDEYRAARQKG